MNLIWVIITIIMVLLQILHCNGCLDKEKIALLNLKTFFDNPIALQHWVGEEDCCQWERVQCSSTTGRVTQLSLNNTRAYWTSGTSYLNASLFLPFQEITNLYLKGNSILGFAENQGFETLLTSLRYLEVLDLSDNLFDETILPPLRGFSSLKYLNLGLNQFTVPIQPQDLPNYENLEDLYLEKLALSNSFLREIGVMTSLKVLSVSDCGLNGTLSNAQGLCELIHLRVLDLSNNDLHGSLPWCFANLISLQQLDLSSNSFGGNISQSPLKSLTSLVDLQLSNNHFQIPFSLGPFFNHSNLKHMKGQNNEIYIQEETELSAPKFQLNSLLLSGCRNSTRFFPNFLYNQHDLQIVDLSNVCLKGEFPNWLLTNNTRLEVLFLANNSLSGNLQFQILPHKNLLALDVSNNFFDSHIPFEIGVYLPELKFLNMSRNCFDSNIPSSFGNMNSLGILDLSENQLSGVIPEHLTIGCFSLHSLFLSNNKLEGQMFSQNFNLTNLWWLQLDGNQLSGSIPDSLSKSSLSILDLSNNSLSGRIPGSLGNLSNLQNLVISNNNLYGSIPLDICRLQYLEILDLAKNNLSGVLPSCFSSSMIHIHLAENRIQGALTNQLLPYSNVLVTLDLSNNQISGRIPNWIGELQGLRYLLLKNNNLYGEIPHRICQLSQLNLVDLSLNNLSGSIPTCLLQDDSVAPTPDAPSTNTNRFEPPLYILPERPFKFTTKHFSYSYYGKILSYLSGIDLSCNKMTGNIPDEIGNLVHIQTLNLSHNKLAGSIPPTFSNLKQIESLDLSYNNLTGSIPSQLTKLNYLSSFSLANNNLYGKTPELTEQFATFDASSYDGNPYLCGLPLPRSCTATEPLPEPRTSASGGDLGFVDMNAFYSSFTASYIVVLIGIFLVLYINPYWRQAWFHLIERCNSSCYGFICKK